MTIRTDIDGAPALTGPWPDPVVPETSLPEFLLATATQQAERAAIIDASSGRTLSYAELADGVRRVASGLAALGLRPGNVFAIMAPNSPEWLLACCGALAARGVVTGITRPRRASRELPKAYVVPAQQVTSQELIDYVAARVAPHKRIHQVSFTDAIPTSPSGKTLRRLLIAGEQHRS